MKLWPTKWTWCFKALADPTRRLLPDRLRERNGQTLGELCSHLGMTRQSATHPQPPWEMPRTPSRQP
jgi:hypothetical protein